GAELRSEPLHRIGNVLAVLLGRVVKPLSVVLLEKGGGLERAAELGGPSAIEVEELVRHVVDEAADAHRHARILAQLERLCATEEGTMGDRLRPNTRDARVGRCEEVLHARSRSSWSRS